MALQLTNQPIKGTSDWQPDEFTVRQYIFNTWRSVNRRFGYDEYLTPIFESADIYRAKSGEDVGGKELMVMTDRAGRELAVRPEMTPSVTRMVTRFFRQVPKPVRLFSIANFWRNERPQKGRNREFWQLNTDIFGAESLNADIEIVQLALECMLAFNPPKDSFTLYMNHRHLIDTVLTDIARIEPDRCLPTVRLLDKFDKIGKSAFTKALADIGIDEEATDVLIRFIESETIDDLLTDFPQLGDDPGYREIKRIFTTLLDMGYGDWIVFNPGIIRGFDYYDGMVFEVFDRHPENNRAMFGGGRYNGLANLFGKLDIPAVGFAPGDETTRIFLENWDLVPPHLLQNPAIFLPLFDETLGSAINKLAKNLRDASLIVEQGLTLQTFKQALNYANKKKFSHVLIFGPDEAEKGIVGLKNMSTGEQSDHAVDDIIPVLLKASS